MQNRSDPASIYDRDGLLKEVGLARAQGSVVVLANGCFDFLHVGHIRYLSAAKKLGDLLVVAINSDRQARRLKGADRPFMPAEERAEVISALRFVDMVTIFDEPTVDELISAIRPDFHAKGTDYTEESVPERQTVLKYGGRVVIVGDAKDHSSTQLVEKAGR